MTLSLQLQVIIANVLRLKRHRLILFHQTPLSFAMASATQAVVSTPALPSLSLLAQQLGGQHAPPAPAAPAPVPPPPPLFMPAVTAACLPPPPPPPPLLPAPASAGLAPSPAAEELRAAIKALLPTVDASKISIMEFRKQVAEHLKIPVPPGLDVRQEEFKQIVAEAMKAQHAVKDAKEHMAMIIAEMGDEAVNFQCTVYLATVSRVLPASMGANGDLRDIADMEREQVGSCFRDAFDNPIAAVTGGRPRSNTESSVKRLVVFRETYEDGEVHFHVAVLLKNKRAFLPAKRTLRQRHHLAVHFSCTHSQFWSTCRYGHIGTLKKPDVDQAPYKWDLDGKDFDLYEVSQRPFIAKCWKRRREQREQTAALAEVPKTQRFEKLDLVALMLDKALTTRAAVLQYTQDYGCEAMQKYVSNHQKDLTQYLQDAAEWGAAREKAAAERVTDWELVCRSAEGACPHGCSCAYAAAAEWIFDNNRCTLNKHGLAISLRAVIMQGPSKTRRIPLVIGQTNTGKSSLFLPVDILFGKKYVFHKPAKNSAFPLRNLLKDKRMIFWDDYRPVEYAQTTIDVPTFLSLFQGQPFEIKVSQSFSDGYEDFEWRRGAVMTAKALDLWKPRGEIDEEDIRHMKSRVEVFECRAPIKNLKEMDPCARCMCHWINTFCAEQDARSVLHAIVPAAAPLPNDEAPNGELLTEVTHMCTRARLSDATVAALVSEQLTLGAMSISELSPDDWRGLEAWRALRPLEARRLEQAMNSA